MEKAEDILFHPWNQLFIFTQLWNTTFYIFTAVKYNFLYFYGCENIAFQIYIIFNRYCPIFHFFVYNKIAH